MAVSALKSPSRKASGKARAATATAPAPEDLLSSAVRELEVKVGEHMVRLTNLGKVFWPDEGLTKGDLLRYYAVVSPYLLPHLLDRALVMKRYPNGIEGEFFFQKHAPVPRPDWVEICTIEHASENVIDFPIVRDLATLLWVVNLGCIDLNPWYARCGDVYRPDYLHFDLDPVEGAGFQEVLETALLVRQGLESLGMKCYAKTTGLRGIHVYVPIVRGPTQKQVWDFSRDFALSLERLHPKIITAEYRVAKRPTGHVLVDYNQNAWGRTLASVYSVRPKPGAPVSTPVTWKEIERGIRMEDFTMLTVPQRLKKLGDLWKPVQQSRGRFKLENLL